MYIRFLTHLSAIILLFALTVSIIFSFIGSTCAAGEDYDPLKILLSMKDAYKNIESYTAVMVKGEPAVSKQKSPQKISVKFKKPFKVYMKWVEGPYNGRELIYVAGRDNDHFIVKPEGVIGFLIRRLKLPSVYRTDDSRYTVRDFGIGNLIDGIVNITLDAQKNDDLDLRFRGVVVRNGREAFEIERFLPGKDAYRNHRLVLYVDAKSHLPLEVYGYNEEGKLTEYCLYQDLILNPHLKEEEFSADNGEYGFSYL